MGEQQKTRHRSLGLEGEEMRYWIGLFVEHTSSGAQILGTWMILY